MAYAMQKSTQCETFERLSRNSVLEHPVEEWVLRRDLLRSLEIEERKCDADCVFRGEEDKSTYEKGAYECIA